MCRKKLWRKRFLPLGMPEKSGGIAVAAFPPADKIGMMVDSPKPDHEP
jgi:hypothetical protein